MQRLKILNTRDLKEIRNKLKEQFDYDYQEDYAFLMNEKGRIYIINKDLSRVDFKKLRVDKFGLYFGELRNQEVRLSMEGAWLVGKKAKKNVIDITKEEVKKYFLGESLNQDLGQVNRFVLLKYDQDVFGCAKYKNKTILSILPKIHRSKDLII